jgi:hypothetical protein
VPASADDLEKWFQSGTILDSGSGATESTVVRMASPEPLQVHYLPRLTLVIGGSILVLLIGLVLSRLPGGIAGPLVALVAGLAAIAAILFPQPTAQIAAAAEPGAAALLLILTVHAAARWYYRQRVTFLPGFARSRPEAPFSSSTGSRPSDRAQPSANGSPGSARGTALPPQPASTGS